MVSAGAFVCVVACLCMCTAAVWVPAWKPRADAARERQNGAACCSLCARMHVRVCSVVVVIMRHCSYLYNNLIKELPDQIFDINIGLTLL